MAQVVLLTQCNCFWLTRDFQCNGSVILLTFRLSKFNLAHAAPRQLRQDVPRGIWHAHWALSLTAVA